MTVARDVMVEACPRRVVRSASPSVKQQESFAASGREITMVCYSSLYHVNRPGFGSPINPAKGQIDPRTARMLFLRNAVFPVALSLTLHQKQATRGEFQANAF
jgi:hypothetical protein